MRSHKTTFFSTNTNTRKGKNLKRIKIHIINRNKKRQKNIYKHQKNDKNIRGQAVHFFSQQTPIK